MRPDEVGYFRDLCGMANNLNQLTKATHQGTLMNNHLIKTLEGINAIPQVEGPVR